MGRSIEDAIFLIEGGKALELVKQRIADRIRVSEGSRALGIELGVSEGSNSISSGILVGVVFEHGKLHPDFTKPKKRGGISYPKKGTVWAKKFDAQQGYEAQSYLISKELGIPLQISYAYKDGHGHGSSHIGSPFNECGFLYLGVDGPYAMWAPDVPAEVAAFRNGEEGMIIDEPANSFQFNIEGVRRIEKEEWEILVAQHKLEEKKKSNPKP